MSIRITCISKDGGNHENPHVAISNLGWVEDGSGDEGNSTRIQMYDWIKNDGNAYVRGTKYVRTHRDGKWTDNLLALPECA